MGYAARSLIRPILTVGRLSIAVAIFFAGPAIAGDPLASNNGMYPDPQKANQGYFGRYNIANLDYPDARPTVQWQPGGGLDAPLNQGNAKDYMLALKKYLEPTMRVLIEDAQNWDAKKARWYDMVWQGAGDPSDPTSGRDAIMNSYGGQIVPSSSWSEPYRPTTEYMQNYGVIYFDELAASMLGKVWADVYAPDLSEQSFPDGSIVVKAEAATVQPYQWPSPDTGSVLAGAAEWKVFRPTTAEQKAHQIDPNLPLNNSVQTVYPFQLAIKVKDSIASPETNWVFMGFVYDARVDGSPWEKFVPAGMMWGNDPQYAALPYGVPLDENGNPDTDKLKQTWVNPEAPPFVKDTLGWGGRMAAPMDVAVRHNVLLPSGQRFTGPDRFQASSCMSCHGTSEFPFSVNLYPSPNRTFPPDGAQFPMYTPGSDNWAQWFQNRRGDVPQSGNIGGKALDYDLVTMFSLSVWAEATGKVGFAFEDMDGH